MAAPRFGGRTTARRIPTAAAVAALLAACASAPPPPPEPDSDPIAGGVTAFAIDTPSRRMFAATDQGRRYTAGMHPEPRWRACWTSAVGSPATKPTWVLQAEWITTRPEGAGRALLCRDSDHRLSVRSADGDVLDLPEGLRTAKVNCVAVSPAGDQVLVGSFGLDLGGIDPAGADDAQRQALRGLWRWQVRNGQWEGPQPVGWQVPGGPTGVAVGDVGDVLWTRAVWLDERAFVVTDGKLVCRGAVVDGKVELVAAARPEGGAWSLARGPANTVLIGGNAEVRQWSGAAAPESIVTTVAPILEMASDQSGATVVLLDDQGQVHRLRGSASTWTLEPVDRRGSERADGSESKPWARAVAIDPSARFLLVGERGGAPSGGRILWFPIASSGAQLP